MSGAIDSYFAKMTNNGNGAGANHRYHIFSSAMQLLHFLRAAAYQEGLPELGKVAPSTAMRALIFTPMDELPVPATTTSLLPSGLVSGQNDV